MSNKWKAAIAILALLCAAIMVSLGMWRFTEKIWPPGEGSEAYIAQREIPRNRYHLDMHIETGTMQVTLTETVTFTNTTGDALEEIAFQINANAYGDEENPPFDNTDLSVAYPLGWGAGGIQFSNVQIDGENARFAVLETNSLILHVYPESPLPSGSAVTIEMHGIVSIPPARGPFGYNAKTFQLSEFYPILCEYADGHWYGEPYTLLLDLPGRDFADYTASINAPADVHLALPGFVTSAQEGDRMLYEVDLPAARDFALSGSKAYYTLSERVGATTVYIHTLSRPSGEKALECAVRALGSYQALFGSEYPYPNLLISEVESIVDTRVYPGVVHVASAYFEREAWDDLEMLTARGIAQIWTGQLVGADYRKEPWLVGAPAIAALLQGYYMEKGEAALGAAYQAYIQPAEWTGYGNTLPLSSQLYDLPSRSTYDSVVYTRGYALMEELRELMGEESYYAALRAYIAEQAFRPTIAEDFIAVFARFDAAIEEYIRFVLSDYAD